LKESNADQVEIKKAVLELKARKKTLEEKELSLIPDDLGFQRARLEDLLKRRFFIDQSFSIYGGISGQYDFGPMGCAMKHNLLNSWRNHFVLEENLLEVDSSILTPEYVLKASGHVERFADLMVKDVKTGECFRADHLIKAHFERLLTNKNLSSSLRDEYQNFIVKLDDFTRDDINSCIKQYEIRSPITNNDLTEALEFNLMFSTSIGPSGYVKGYLRPETAQGIFVNFKRLLDFNQGKLPFGAAQIGPAFRNEISPRSGLIRVREFTMAEIEYFVDPANKDHKKYNTIKDLELNIYSACDQMDGKSASLVKIENAVDQKTIANQTLAYFMARIYLFLTKIGVDPKRLRFRQHMANEMAHYACDCWDAECLTSYGWVECVGCADRSCYDLTQHSKATNTKLAAEKKLKEPKVIDVTQCVPQKPFVGKTFKADAKLIVDGLSNMSLNEIEAMSSSFSSGQPYKFKLSDKTYEITSEMVEVRRFPKIVHVEEIIPSVIEPSFGVGRIMYSIWEHNFRTREGDEQRTYIALPPILAPVKCSILPLSSNPDFDPFIRQISNSLRELDISHRIDDSSGSIGRRYSRTDEIAIPFGVTIDFDTLKSANHTVTLRERDSMQQIRLSVSIKSV